MNRTKRNTRTTALQNLKSLKNFAISRLGVPSAKEVRALSREVSQLKANVEKLRRTRARA